jgi:hypothetical protein
MYAFFCHFKNFTFTHILRYIQYTHVKIVQNYKGESNERKIINICYRYNRYHKLHTVRNKNNFIFVQLILDTRSQYINLLELATSNDDKAIINIDVIVKLSYFFMWYETHVYYIITCNTRTRALLWV